MHPDLLSRPRPLERSHLSQPALERDRRAKSAPLRRGNPDNSECCSSSLRQPASPETNVDLHSDVALMGFPARRWRSHPEFDLPWPLRRPAPNDRNRCCKLSWRVGLETLGTNAASAP